MGFDEKQLQGAKEEFDRIEGKKKKTHQVTKNKRAGCHASKEMCDYLGFIYLDPIGEEDGRSEKLMMTLESKRVKRTMLEKIYAQAMANTPPGWIPIVTIRSHNSRVQDAFVVMRASDFKNLLEQLEEFKK